MKNRLRTLSPFWWILMTVAIWVVILSFAYRSAKRELDLYRRTRSSLVELRGLETAVSADRQVLEERHGGPAPVLEDVVGSEMLQQVQVERNPPVSLPGGMRLATVRLRFQHLRWDQVRDLITRLESSRPPWRVEALEIEAGLRDLSGSLDLVTLDRPEPEVP